jgi:hypothetical protein
MPVHMNGNPVELTRQHATSQKLVPLCVNLPTGLRVIEERRRTCLFQSIDKVEIVDGVVEEIITKYQAASVLQHAWRKRLRWEPPTMSPRSLKRKRPVRDIQSFVKHHQCRYVLLNNE